MTEPNETTTALVVSGSGMGSGQVLFTPRGYKDIAIQVITPFALIAVRGVWAFANSFVGGLIGMLGAQAVGHPIVPPGDFLHMVAVCASLAGATTGLSVLKNVSAQLTALGDKYPLLKA